MTEPAFACDLTPVTINLNDSYGDGWNGNELNIAEGFVVLTLDAADGPCDNGATSSTSEDLGECATHDACLPDGLHLVTCGGGLWASEVSWEILAEDGTVLLAGDAGLTNDDFFEGYLQIGEVVDVPGCMDPTAVNYDETATIDDGSCYYEGDQCDVALTAVLGENTSDGETEWFKYTATMDGILTVTSQNETGDAAWDTNLSLHDGDCASLELLGANDDCCGYWGPSTVEIDIVAGEMYTILWTNSYNPGPFTWHLEESPPPTNPQNFTVWGGVERAYLEWEGILPILNGSGSVNIANNTDAQSQLQLEQAYALEKKSMIHTNTGSTSRVGARLNSEFAATNSRTTTVTIECDDGDPTNTGSAGGYPEEISWALVYSGADGVLETEDDVTVATGLSPAGTFGEDGTYTPLTAELEDGLYRVDGTDSWGDGWTGNFFSVFSETMTYVNWSAEGTGGSQEFTVSSDPANLTLSNLMYDQSMDEISVDITNSGGVLAWDVSVAYYLTTAVSGDCQATTDAAYWGPNVAAGETVTMPLAGLDVPGLLGYGTFDIGASVDWLCLVPESNEEDNTTTATITLVDPLEDISFNVYRSVDDAADPVFEMVATELDAEDYMDVLVAGDYVWYVTQVTAGVESDSSNWDYATVYGSDDFPAPTDLMVEGNDYDAMLMWTAPDLTDWDGPMASNFNPGPSNMKQHGTGQTNVTPPAVRQGGDTFETATPIEQFPYENTGSTVGFVPDYGPYDDLVDVDGDGYADTYCEYVGWLGQTGAAADVVYSMSLAEMTNVSITTCGSQEAFPDTYYDTALGIFTMEDDGTGQMVPVLVAANDDFCGDGFQAEINCELPSGDYYIVVSGYSANEGDYHIAVTNLDDVPPIAGYYVYRDGEEVGVSIGMDATSYEDTDLEDPDNPGGAVTYTYEVSAYYSDWDMESATSNPAEITLPQFNCYPPGDLMAETSSNNVMLDWTTPPGQGGYMSWYNDTLFTGLGAGTTPWEAGVKFPVADQEEFIGMALTKVGFIPLQPAEEFKIFVYDPVTGMPVDSTEAIDGTALPLQQWYEVDLPNPVLIDGVDDLMFGYRVTGLEGSFPAGMDTGPAVQGFGDLIKGFGADWSSVAYSYGFDYNWAIQGYATYAGGRAVSSMEPVEVAIPMSSSSSLSARSLEEPVTVLNQQMDRSLLGYKVHRGDHHLGNVGPGAFDFMDDWVPWGDYTYHVSAMYDHGLEGACAESEPASVEVSLMNSAPNPFDLVQPLDGSTVEVTLESIQNGSMINFVWQGPSDPDNDVVHYHPHIVGHSEGDTLVEWEAPVMAQPNPSFEENADGATTLEQLAPWGTWPPELANFSFETNGNGIYGSDATLEVYDGEHALKVWGQYGEENFPNNTPVYQGHSVEAMGLEPGDVVAIEGHMMSHADDWVGQGANSAYLFLSFFDENWGWLSSDLSAMMDRTMPPSEWHQFFALAVVPEGAVHMNAGVEYWQVSGNDHGSVYFDDVNMFVPVTSTIITASHEELVMAAMEDGVHHVTVDWNIGAMDVWDETMAANGPFTFTLDLSSTLGIDESTIPDVFALHNNYPNPFNPVTNITYDIPEVADVKLEIYNIMGQKVRTLATGSHEPGRYRVLWNATNDYGQGLSSGMYIYKIQAGDFVSVKKLVLMK